MVFVNEVYLGKVPEVEAIFEEFCKFRHEYSLIRTGKYNKNTAKLEKMIEDFWGFSAFSLMVDPSPVPNAYTYPVACSIDVNPADYIVTTSKGYRFNSTSKTACVSYITRGLLKNDNFTDEEVFAAFLHEIGHSFVHRSPLVIAQQEVYKNAIIISIIQRVIMGAIQLNPNLIFQAVMDAMVANSFYKTIMAESNKMAKKIPVLRGITISVDYILNTMMRFLNNFVSFILNLTGITHLANLFQKTTYDKVDKKQMEISGHTNAYARSAERLSDDFAAMYGYGPAISTALLKMESPDNQGAFRHITRSIPILGTWFKKQDALATELNGVYGAHPSTPDRMLSIVEGMEADLKKDKAMPEKVKKECKENIKKLRSVINDLKANEPEIQKNKNLYIQALTVAGLMEGNTEDRQEKRFTNRDELEKFYRQRKVRKEAALAQEAKMEMLEDDIFEVDDWI